jgi:hypothetical protein
MRGGEELDDMDRYFAALPSLLLPYDGPPLTEAQLADLKRRFDAAANSPRYRWLYKGRWRKALPLPWHTRLRLWYTSRVNGLAIWLLDHRRERAATALWRITGHWK